MLPAFRRNEVVAFIEQGLRDVCITRAAGGWGVPVPDDPSQVVYGWSGAVSKPMDDLRDGRLIKEHRLPKLYGAYVCLVQSGREPRGKPRYGVVIGLSTLTAMDRTTPADPMQRVIDRVGRNIRHSRHWPVVVVHNVESWNAAHPEMPVTRHR